MNNKLIELTTKYYGVSIQNSVKLASAGSNRVYYRFDNGKGRTVVGVEGTSVEENRAFFNICRQFRKEGLPVPELYIVSDDETCYLQEDLGDISLYDLLQKSREAELFDKDNISLLEQIIRTLPDFQFLGAKNLDFSKCYPLESFNRRSILWDLNYFKYCFFKTTGIEFHEDLLENDFERLTDILLSDNPFNTFMYRDFQSRNIMIHNGMPWFIDFQGGRKGPIEYDLVSFLWQAKAAYPEELKHHLIEVYLKAVSKYRKIDTSLFLDRLKYFVLFRTLQVLGAYGFRGNFEHKTHFLQSIPFAIANVKSLLTIVEKDFPYLTGLLSQLAELPQYAVQQTITSDILTVHITSFSFRKGIPEDKSGNGGGFVFDCRSMHNPGLYDQYKQLNGTSKAVSLFLEEQGEVQKYLQNVYGLIVPAVEKYLKRGFTNLMVNFGCTGGQHRSVYCAEHLGDYLHSLFGDKIHVEVEHREMNIIKGLTK